MIHGYCLVPNFSFLLLCIAPQHGGKIRQNFIFHWAEIKLGYLHLNQIFSKALIDRGLKISESLNKSWTHNHAKFYLRILTET